jgi:sialic acid synthase SpsE
LEKYKLDYIKIPSGEITNYPFLKQISKLKKKVLLSTGMATLVEIKQALTLDKKKLYKIGSPFYKKDTTKKISKKIISFRCNLKKNFNDLN